MAGYGVLVPMGNNTFEWGLDDVISLYDSARSPSFVFENVPFHVRLNVYPKEDRLQLSIHTEITSNESFQVSFVMGTGFGGQLETRSGKMDKDYFFIRRWMPWSEMLKRRLEILQNGCLVVTIKLQKEEKTFAQAKLPGHIKTDGETTAEGKESFDSKEVVKTSVYENNECTEKNKVVSAEDSDDEDSTVLPNNIRELRKALKSLLRSGDNSDVTIKIGNKEFPAHKCILGMRSPAFKSTFEHDMLEKKTGCLSIDDCDPETFEDFLYHLYTGSTSHVNSRNASSLYVISHKYKLDELKKVCLSCMKEKLTCDTFCDTMSLALLYEEKELVRLATEFFCDFGRKIIETVDWQLFLEKNTTAGNELFRKCLNEKGQK